MVDPQGQANRWVRGLEGPRGLRVVRAGDARALTILAGAVRTGSAVLIEDVGETIDPALQPLLVNETFVQVGKSDFPKAPPTPPSTGHTRGVPYQFQLLKIV